MFFAAALTRRLQSHRDFEAVQTLQKVFFKIHGEEFVENSELRRSLENLLNAQRAESARLLELVSSSLGTLAFVRDIM